MPEEGSGPPVVPMPERLDRPMRLGPFPSGRAALKFVVCAAIGATLVPVAGLYVWVGFLAGGLLVGLWQPDGIPIDSRTAAVVRWGIRRRAGDPPMTRPDSTGVASPTRGVVPLASGGYAAILRVGGVPLAYLPPAELRRRFEQYRDLLRATDTALVVYATCAPIHVVPFVPLPITDSGPEATAQTGYRELAQLIVQRRSVRQVYIGLSTPERGADALRQLEGRIVGLTERLTGLGLAPQRVVDRALPAAARRVGFQPAGSAR